MRSFLSLSFFRPAKAIFVPGMYCRHVTIRIGRREYGRVADLFGVLEVLEEGVRVPGDTLVHVGSGVREAVDLARLAAEDSVDEQARR